MKDGGLVEVGCTICAPARPKARKMFAKGGLDVVRCSRCRLVYVNPRLSRVRLWERYDEKYFTNEYIPSFGDFDSKLNLLRHAHILDAVEQYRENNRFLDAGCAVGFLLHAAKSKGWETLGLEVSEYAAKYGTEHLGLNIINSALEQADLAPRSFDVITLCDTLEHLEDPAGAIRKVHELLRPGGAVFIVTPNFNSLNRLLFGHRWGVIGPTEHIYYFTPKTIRTLLGRSGLTAYRTRSNVVDTYHYLRGNVNEVTLSRYQSFMRRTKLIANPLVRLLKLGDDLEVLAGRPR